MWTYCASLIRQPDDKIFDDADHWPKESVLDRRQQRHEIALLQVSRLFPGYTAGSIDPVTHVRHVTSTGGSRTKSFPSAREKAVYVDNDSWSRVSCIGKGNERNGRSRRRPRTVVGHCRFETG